MPNAECQTAVNGECLNDELASMANGVNGESQNVQ
jgi:hypothetical protein